MTEPTLFPTASAFRKWLEKNHDRTLELLIGFHRVDSGKGGLTYREALDEALCLGWIDGLRKHFDADSYTIRFTPRKPDSIWSVVNSTRIDELIKLDRVHPAGRKVFQRAMKRNRNSTRMKWGIAASLPRTANSFVLIPQRGSSTRPRRRGIGGSRAIG